MTLKPARSKAPKTRKNASDKFPPARAVQVALFDKWLERRNLTAAETSRRLTGRASERAYWSELMTRFKAVNIGEAIEIARLLSIPLIEVLRAFGYDAQNYEVPVVGKVRGSAVEPLGPNDARFAIMPGASAEIWSAIQLDAERPAGGLAPQAMLYYRHEDATGDPVYSVTEGVLSLISALDGSRYVGTVAPGAVPEVFTVRGLDGKHAYGPARLRAVWPIGWINLQHGAMFGN